MSETWERIRRLPRTMKNPFQGTSKEERAGRVIASLTRLEEFKDPEEVARVINMVQPEPPTVEPSNDLGHKTKDLKLTVTLLESRMRNGELSERVANRYLKAIQEQIEIKSQKPALLDRFYDRYKATNPVVLGVGINIILSIPFGLSSPYDSVEEYIFRVGAGSLASPLYFLVVKK